MSRVAVVGAGTMGNGVAHVFAEHGWDTVLIDVAPGFLERALATIRANFERQVKKGTVTAERRDAALARIRVSSGLDAVKDRAGGDQVQDLPRARPAGAAGGGAGQQYLVDLDHHARRADQAPRPGDRDAFHEPGAGDAAG